MKVLSTAPVAGSLEPFTCNKTQLMCKDKRFNPPDLKRCLFGINLFFAIKRSIPDVLLSNPKMVNGN